MPNNPAGNGRTTKRPSASRLSASEADSLDLDELLTVLAAVRRGDFSVRMRPTRTGVAGKVADTLNEIVQLNQEMAREFERVGLAVGKEGRITQRAQLGGAGGSWAASINSMNALIVDLVQPTSEVARVIGAVAKGDLSQTMALEIEGRPLIAVFVELAKKGELLRRQTEMLLASEQAARELAAEQAELVRDLEHKNRELESFSYAVSHDLRAPLRRIDSFTRAVLDTQGGALDDDGRRFLDRVRESIREMAQLIDDVLYLSRVTRAELREQEVDLSALAALAAERLRESAPDREVEVRIRPGVVVTGDAQLLRIAVENLVQNAWKFTGRQPAARIEFGVGNLSGEPAYFVRDNGAGFDMAYVDRLFGPFQRLHLADEFPGSGIGLATVQRIVHRHGGRVWAEGLVGQGATFHFTIGRVRG